MTIWEYHPVRACGLLDIQRCRALVGEPDRVATSNTDTYFYYDCVDGTVETEVNTGVLLQGEDVMLGELRYY